MTNVISDKHSNFNLRSQYLKSWKIIEHRNVLLQISMLNTQRMQTLEFQNGNFCIFRNLYIDSNKSPKIKGLLTLSHTSIHWEDVPLLHTLLNSLLFNHWRSISHSPLIIPFNFVPSLPLNPLLSYHWVIFHSVSFLCLLTFYLNHTVCVFVPSIHKYNFLFLQVQDADRSLQQPGQAHTRSIRWDEENVRGHTLWDTHTQWHT